MRTASASVAALALLLVAPLPAAAQRELDFEIPVLVLDQEADDPTIDTADIDLANIVRTASKRVTTIQEAPTIVTVIAEADLRDRHDTTLPAVLDQVPGWLPFAAANYVFPYVAVRGTTQSVLVLQDGLSLFDPMFNFTDMGRVPPLELVERVEVITGPSGVLWGANSYLGLINIITRGPEDVEGVEVGIDMGTGPGDPGRLRGYVLAGATEIAGTDVNALVHASFESYHGQSFRRPQEQFGSTAPSPRAPTVFGEPVSFDQDASLLLQLNAHVEAGPVDVRVSAPWHRSHPQSNFSGFVADDTLVHRTDFYTRFVTVDYERRFANNRAGLSARGYAMQINRATSSFFSLPPSDLLSDGLSIAFDATSYRVGSAVDGTLELDRGVYLLYGAEAFHEWLPDTTENSQQGPGIEVVLASPADLSRIPLPCPREPDPDSPGNLRFVPQCPMTMAFQTDRTVLGTYVNPQWRPHKRVTLDGGARVQAAPAAFSESAYDTQLLLSGALVYNFAEAWNFKLNYAEGFRPPTFNGTASNSRSIQIGGNPDLEVERSKGVQTELNARLLRGVRRIRELNVRGGYSYTRLEDIIQPVNMTYVNAGERGIHSAELLAKLYIQGGHRFELGYTWMNLAYSDYGRPLALPEHWFSLSGVVQLSQSLRLSSTARILGAMEDVNQLVDSRTLMQEGTLVNTVTDVVLDRIPPSADLQLALSYEAPQGFNVTGAVYNALNAHRYQPVPLENPDAQGFLSNPYPGLRAVLSATYTY